MNQIIQEMLRRAFCPTDRVRYLCFVPNVSKLTHINIFGAVTTFIPTLVTVRNQGLTEIV